MKALAYEHNGKPVDAARFYEIACDPRRGVAVEACAGSGKTWMLVSRILRALLAGAQPHEILAITFTRKAAGEMRQRLHEWLEQFARASPQELSAQLRMRGIAHPTDDEVARLKGLHAQVLASGRPVRIQTFHAWFGALLRNAPLAVMDRLGLPANYNLLEDDTEAVDRVWRRFYAALAAQPEARADFEASVAAHGRSQTRKALEAALAKRVEFAFADKDETVIRSVKPFADQFPQFAGLADPLDLLKQPRAARSFADAARALGGASAPTFAAKGAELEMALASGDVDGVLAALLTRDGPRKFSEKIANLALVREAQELALQVVEVRRQHEAWLHHQRMTRLTRVLVAEFAAVKREHGWIDMHDVEQAAQLMLSDPVLSGWVLERLDARTRHLLVDEFQDTNPLQWQALHAWLSGYAGAGGEPPGVFIVGDPKQSIYRFRRAEPQVFKAAQDFILQLGGDRLSCDHTRRNSQAVISTVNAVMAAAQAQHEYQGFRDHSTASSEEGGVFHLPQVPREAAGAGAQDEASGELAWRDSLTTPRDLPEEKLVEVECRQAAHWIAGEIAAGAKPGDIMVLARRRSRLAAMEAQLRELRIPAQQPEKNDLCEAPEVQDVVALFDALVSPTHDLSLARALKSPIFSLADEALVSIALAARAARDDERPASWFELLQSEEEAAPGLRAAGQMLAEWKALVETLPPHDALEEIYRRGSLVAKFAGAAPLPMRDSVIANLKALPGAALNVDGGRYATPYGFVRALKAGRIEAPPLTAEGAVQLLTVHGAKGLEAPVVLMLDTDAPPPRAETMGVIVEWPGEAPAPWRFAFIASETRPPPCSVEALEVERTERQREELNALYVAMTRARSRLVISSAQPHQASEASWWQRLLPHCRPLPAPRPPQPLADVRAEPATICVLPALEILPEALPAQPPADSDESRFGQAMHRLLENWNAASRDFDAAAIRRVSREFSLPPGKAEEAAAMARAILSGEGAWAWDSTVVDWQGNEVPMQHEGLALRLDRLVRHAPSGEWWVLDYKAAARPERDASLLEQMRGYRAAVQAANPGAVVHAAFLTGKGKLVKVT